MVHVKKAQLVNLCTTILHFANYDITMVNVQKTIVLS